MFYFSLTKVREMYEYIIAVCGILFIIGSILTAFLIISLRNNNIFVDKKYVKLVVNESTYFDSMNTLDLQARGANSREVYKNRYLDGIAKFSSAQKSVLQKLVRQANIYLSGYPRLAGIKWKFAYMKDHKVENGFPHTLGDIIILPASFFKNNEDKQLETIIHEKIHIYQRMYPLETNEYIINVLHFEIKNIPSEVRDKIRSNPDLNNVVYGRGSYAFAQVFKDSPASLYDSYPAKIDIKTLNIETIVGLDVLPLHIQKYVGQIEHPYEIMACYLAHALVNNDRRDVHTVNWMIKYL